MAKLGNVELKIITEENKKYTNEVTEKPIENQQDIADHINHNPASLTFDFVVSGDNAEEKCDELLRMRESDEVYTYFDVKELRLYKNMAITSLNITDNKNNKSGFFGSLSLKQVRIVEQQTSIINIGVDPVTGAEGQVSPGETETREPDSEDIDDNTESPAMSSLLFELIGGS